MLSSAANAQTTFFNFLDAFDHAKLVKKQEATPAFKVVALARQTVVNWRKPQDKRVKDNWAAKFAGAGNMANRTTMFSHWLAMGHPYEDADDQKTKGSVELKKGDADLKSAFDLAKTEAGKPMAQQNYGAAVLKANGANLHYSAAKDYFNSANSKYLDAAAKVNDYKNWLNSIGLPP